MKSLQLKTVVVAGNRCGPYCGREGAMLAEPGIPGNRVAGLQTLPPARLLEAMNAMGRRETQASMGEAATRFPRFIDGKILPGHPFDPVASPVPATVPIPIGWNNHEQSLFQGRDPGVFNMDEALHNAVSGRAPHRCGCLRFLDL